MLNDSEDLLQILELEENQEDTRVFSPSTMSGYSDWYKEHEELQIWWVDKLDERGRHLFSFDKKKIYNLFADYPQNMTDEEVKIFNAENPYWTSFLNQGKSKK